MSAYQARVALITGATDGVGKATARSLLRDGWTVVITGRSAAKCEATVRELSNSEADAKVSSLLADLSSMGEVARLATEFCERHPRLDLLILNANSITQTHTLTSEGFEANLAVGDLGRALLTWELEPALARAPAPQVLTVVGLNLERLDFDDPSSREGFSSMRALGRWQWAMQLFAREYNRRSRAAMNTYMPGLVKTKILANEPQPMRLFVQIASRLMGVEVDRAGDELAEVVRALLAEPRRDAYFARTKHKGQRALDERPGDGARLVAMTEALLSSWRSPR